MVETVQAFRKCRTRFHSIQANIEINIRRTLYLKNSFFKTFTNIDIPEMTPLSNLVGITANFVGRSKELVDVIRLFERDKVARVCIYGPGGIGKSEFAKMIATWMSDRGHVSSVLWTSADPAESENNVLDLLSLIELTKSFFNLQTSDTNIERQKQHIYHYVRSHPTLFVIDGWENLNSKNRWPISFYISCL